jgi:hypothetical protein
MRGEKQGKRQSSGLFVSVMLTKARRGGQAEEVGDEPTSARQSLSSPPIQVIKKGVHGVGLFSDLDQ